MGSKRPEVQAYIEMQNSFKPFEMHKVFDLGIERRADGKLIGIVTAILKDHRKAEIGYALGIEHRKRGYASEAAKALTEYGFAELGLHRVQAIASSANLDSLDVLKRLGMKLEGTLREANIRHGAWCDLLYYGILETEWNTEEQRI